MKNNLLLTIAELCCKGICLLIILGFAVLTVGLIYWHINPDAYKDIVFIAALTAYTPHSFLGYTITETWAVGDTSTTTPFAWANVKRFSLYFIYLQSDRKSTRLNSSLVKISYAVFCLKKKKKKK